MKTIFNQILTLSLESLYTMAQKTFPDYFADAGKEESTEIAEFQRALRQVQMVREMISLQVQVDFEEAEFLGDECWFANNWDSYKHGLVFHGLASFGTFFWTNFRYWLNKISDRDDSAREALNLFNNHQAFNKVSSGQFVDYMDSLHGV